MRKARIAKIVGIVAAIPMLTLATTGSAYADGYNITWQNRGTKLCLAWGSVGSDQVSLHAANDGLFGCGSESKTLWDDIQSGLADQTGAYWKETPGSDSGTCLTSYWANPATGAPGMAYLEPCTSPANYYEQWQENWVGNGFNIVNRATGYCLDNNKQGQVYSLPCNGGQFQVWY